MYTFCLLTIFTALFITVLNSKSTAGLRNSKPFFTKPSLFFVVNFVTNLIEKMSGEPKKSNEKKNEIISSKMKEEALS